MSDSELSPVKRALLELRELRARLDDIEYAAHEPIAIVGLGIRIPGGVQDASGFADLLWNSTDAIGPIPAERWKLDDWYDAGQHTPGKMTTRFGGFIDAVDRFDADFFGIAPLEAASMDPQQRILLELAWHALEDAGHAPASLARTRAGVYLGIASSDYGRALLRRTELIDPYFSSGSAFSVAAGRIAYVLGLHGPAIALDTACSSSLVAIHLACQALRRNECDLALAGGINLILTPEMNIGFSKAGMMARDGRCKTFDAAADGYVRGEGGAIMVLRRLRDAQASSDRILALVRGSAVNQDGRSNGLTAPNGGAQEAVVRAALADAGVLPAQIGYVETHGTGTPLGDPIEVNALAAVLGQGRSASTPLLLGSVKTNIGHLEAAAGVVGLAKTALALQRREIPAHLHLQTRNPYIAWSSTAMDVPVTPTPWHPIDGLRLGGVSSFGFSGTNAHVVLEEAPAVMAGACDGAPRPLQLLALSARDDAALAELAASWRRELAMPGADAQLGNLCFTANAGRSHFQRRISVQGADASAIGAGLAAWQQGTPHPAVLAGVIAEQAPRVAFLFPGQGPQYVGMGRALYEASPVFRAAFDQCCDSLDELLPQPLRPIVFGAADAGLLDQTVFAQPAMFAIEISLAALWRSWGVTPAAVLGHSFGEYAAACVAGALSVADGARMVATRGRLAQALPGDGAMMVVEASEAEVERAIARQGGRVSVAAVNGASNVVISGERAAVESIASGFQQLGLRTKSLRVSHAFHSPLMDPVLAEFQREIAGVQFSEPRVALVSNLTGRFAGIDVIGSPSYWCRHLRETVRFADSIRTLAAQGITHYIEMSPQPVLLGMGSDCVEGACWLPCLRQGSPDWQTMLESLQTLYAGGAQVDWAGVDQGQGRRRVSAPGYPFQRKRHWIDGPLQASAAPDPAVRWSRLCAALDSQAERGPLDLNAASYPEKWACLARLTVGHAIHTFRAAKLFAAAGERRQLDEVMAVARIGGTYLHLMHRWLQGLVRDGLLRVDGLAYVSDQPLPDPRLDQLWADAAQQLTDNQPMLAYLRNCGRLVADVLTGRESPLETLFPDGSFDLAQDIYERSTTMRYINQLAAAAFDVLGTATPQGAALRVLEIGAGTGGTSASLLPALPVDRRRYRFTDVSDAFLTRARMRFSGEKGVEFGLFDLEKDPGAQGYLPRSFDVIVAANAVHAVKDLRAALGRIAGLLAPGGMLVLVESTVHLDYFDMTTGLIEGWQHFADDLRDDNPLLPPASWIEALRAAGFDEARAWPPAGSAAENLGQHVLVARMAGNAVVSAAGMDPASVATADVAATPDGLDQQASSWLAQFEAALPGERLDLMRELVRSKVTHILRRDADSAPALQDRLMDLGMDSLMAVQLRNALNVALQLKQSLPSTLMFDYPTVDAIALQLLDRLDRRPAAGSPRAAAAGSADVLSADAVADLSDDDIARLLDERAGPA